MPGLRKPQIAQRLTSVIEKAGAEVLKSAFADSSRTLPWRCRVEFPAGIKREYTMYFWTVSHGGRGRSNDEFRIQTKLKEGNQLKVRSGTTLLLGWFEPERIDSESYGSLEDKAVIAWNALDRLKVGKSSSCQVKWRTIREAMRAGASSQNRQLQNGQMERVIAVREDYFVRYLLAASGGHQAATVGKMKRSSFVRRQLRSKK